MAACCLSRCIYLYDVLCAAFTCVPLNGGKDKVAAKPLGNFEPKGNLARML